MHPELIQGTPQWLALRKTKITATDSAVIMGKNPWKSVQQLYDEKMSDEPPSPPNAAMQRGIELEPIARDLYEIKTGWNVQPKVVIKDWAMASLDGIDEYGHIVEIKCPGEKVHNMALKDKIPDYYYPQLQHQMFVCDAKEMNYFSFDGLDGVIVKVKRDQEFIDCMVEKEMEFFKNLTSKIRPGEDLPF